MAGTQADEVNKNQLLVMKLSDLHRTKGDDGDDSDEDSDDEGLDDDPVMEHRALQHTGAVNRPVTLTLPGDPVMEHRALQHTGAVDMPALLRCRCSATTPCATPRRALWGGTSIRSQE